MIRRGFATLILLAVAGQAPAAGAVPCPEEPGQRLRPCGLEVLGGEESWHPDNVFVLRWRNPAPDGGPPPVAVQYRVLDDSLEVVRERRIDRPAETAEPVVVPPVPGVYTAEVRLQDAAGNLGPAATASLRFDDSRPGPVTPPPRPGWIGRGDFPFPLHLGLPAGPQPISGIRGYAIAVGRDPCQAFDRCTEAETSPIDGDDDTLAIQSLPEGTIQVHAVAVSGAGMKSASAGRATLRVDTTAPTTTLSEVPGAWADGPVELLATAIDSASGMAPAGPAGPFTAIRVGDAAPVAAAGDSVRTRIVGAGVHTVVHYARDAAGNVDDGVGTNPAPESATVRIDPVPPRLAFANAQDPAAPETIEVRVLDALSGPSRRSGRIEIRPAGSGERFAPLPTTVEEGVLRARWESESYPPGPYEFRATGFDLAGNGATTHLRANGSRMVLSAPLKGTTRLRVQLSGDQLRGWLGGGRRHPLAGMTVRVAERFDTGAARQSRISVVRTDSAGAFGERLPPGPSREVVASFAGTASLGRSQSDPVRLKVPGRVWTRASRKVATIGGRPVVFSGRVVGEVPAGGKYVQLQFQAPGLPWAEFRTVRTDARGRFRYAYRFSDDDSRGVRFRFRAFVPAQDDWPYEPVGSRPVAVRGR